MLRKHLRTFGENQINNIIRRTKGKKTLKFHQFYNIQRQKIPERIRISLENHSSPTENSQKPIFLNEKPLKNRKLRKKFLEIFRKYFWWHPVKSHSAEILEESLTLAKRFVSSKNWGAASVKQILKKSHRKNTGLLKQQKSDIAFSEG